MFSIIQSKQIPSSSLFVPSSLGVLSVEHEGREFSVISSQGKRVIERADLQPELRGLATNVVCHMMELGYFSLLSNGAEGYALRFDARLLGGVARNAARTASHGLKDSAAIIGHSADVLVKGSKETATLLAQGATQSADTLAKGSKETATLLAKGTTEAAQTVVNGVTHAGDKIENAGQRVKEGLVVLGGCILASSVVGGLLFRSKL